MSSKLTIANLVKLANDNAVRTGGDMDLVRRTVAENDVVVAIWPDSARPEGIDLIVIKGADILREVVASQQTYRGKITALTCIEAAHAEALRRVCGEAGRLQ